MKLEVCGGVIVRPFSTCMSCCLYGMNRCPSAKCQESTREDKTGVAFESYRIPVKVIRTISVIPVDARDWLLLMERTSDKSGSYFWYVTSLAVEFHDRLMAKYQSVNWV